MDLSLACRGLARAALDHLTHDDGLDGSGVYPGARDGLADGHCAELWRGKRRESAEIAAYRSADSRKNDGGRAIAHVALIRFEFARAKVCPKCGFVTSNRNQGSGPQVPLADRYLVPLRGPYRGCGLPD